METALRIRILGDPALRKRAKLVSKVTPGHGDILSQMARLMYASSGIGLAAPQLGLNEAMIVVDTGSGLYQLINPRIIKREGRQVQEEGCLSIPGICIKIRRSRKVLVRAMNGAAEPVEIAAEGLFACVLQHEIDHLKGKLIVDYASFLDKLKIKRKIGELKKRPGDERLSEEEAKSCKLQL